jgi:hypothetical protein
VEKYEAVAKFLHPGNQESFYCEQRIIFILIIMSIYLTGPRGIGSTGKGHCIAVYYSSIPDPIF